MINRIQSLCLCLVLAAGVLVSFVSDASAQVRVTVGGQTYDITANIGSFNDVQSTTGNELTNTTTAPWFTNTASFALAQDFANAWLAVNDTSAIPLNAFLHFAYRLNTGTFPSVDHVRARNDAGGLSGPTNTNSLATSSSEVPGPGPDIFDFYYATATLVEVPEINGSALAQMLLVLLVGYLMVWARRQRRV